MTSIDIADRATTIIAHLDSNLAKPLDDDEYVPSPDVIAAIETALMTYVNELIAADQTQYVQTSPPLVYYTPDIKNDVEKMKLISYIESHGYNCPTPFATKFIFIAYSSPIEATIEVPTLTTAEDLYTQFQDAVTDALQAQSDVRVNAFITKILTDNSICCSKAGVVEFVYTLQDEDSTTFNLLIAEMQAIHNFTYVISNGKITFTFV